MSRTSQLLAMREALTVLALTAALAGVSCSEADQVNTPRQISNLSGAEVAQQQAVADDLEGQGIWRPVFPTYIPNGLDHLPRPANKGTGGSSDGVTLVFSRDTDGRDLPVDGPLAVNLDLVQGTGGGTIVLASPIISLDGIEASEQEVHSAPGFVVYGLAFSASGQSVELFLEWGAPDDVLTEEMKHETQLMAKSIIDGLRSDE